MVFISEALATASTTSAAQPSPISGFIPIIIIFVIFYFLLIRPQQKRVKQHNDMISAIKKEDVVVTSGGIVGKVQKILEGDFLQVKISEDVIIEVVKSTITSKLDRKFSAVKKSPKKVSTTKKNSTKKS